MNRIFPFERHHLRSNHLFDGISRDTIGAFENEMIELNFKKGELIFRENTFPSGLYIVVEGKVKKFTIGYDGKPHLFYICKEGEILGYHAILSEEPYADSSQALTDCKIKILPKELFIKQVEEDRELERNLLKNLSHEFGFFITSTKILSQLSVRQRTAVMLLMLEEKFTNKDFERQPIVLGRDDFASLVGTAKESLVRVLHDLKEEKLIVTEGKNIIISNREGLLRLARFI